MLRQPVVAVVGHVDHGKSTLLDYIRKTNVAEKEAGGITQRLGAYEAVHKTAEGVMRRISFIDTPGHEAFGSCRACATGGADVAILAVASDEGVKPQTVESVKILTAYKIPFVVALTKTDKPNTDLERAKQSLAEKEIFVEGYGGAIPFAPVSAKTGAGISELLDLVLLLADMNAKPCDSIKLAEGLVLESERSAAKGIFATLVVREGALRKGLSLVAGKSLSTMRLAEDYAGKPLVSIGCGQIARVGGWSEPPVPGESFRAYENKKDAERAITEASAAQNTPKKILEKKDETERVVIPLIVKADTAGSIAAIKHEADKIGNDKIAVSIVSAGQGDVGEGDLRLAGSIGGSLVIGFNVGLDAGAKNATRATGGAVVHIFDIIYRLAEFLEETARARTPKEKREEVSAQARIVKIFSEEKGAQVVGGKVLEGTLETGDEFQIVRRGVRIGTGKIKELQKFKERVREAAVGAEFGARAAYTFPLAQGDTIEVVKIIEV